MFRRCYVHRWNMRITQKTQRSIAVQVAIFISPVTGLIETESLGVKSWILRPRAAKMEAETGLAPTTMTEVNSRNSKVTPWDRGSVLELWMYISCSFFVCEGNI